MPIELPFFLLFTLPLSFYGQWHGSLLEVALCMQSQLGGGPLHSDSGPSVSSYSSS